MLGGGGGGRRKGPARVNPIWTGLFANLEKLGGGAGPPPNLAI